MQPIKKEHLDKCKDAYLKNDKNTIIRHALNKNSIFAITANADGVKDMDFNFELNIKTMAVTNQKASGRCWIFAATTSLGKYWSNTQSTILSL